MNIIVNDNGVGNNIKKKSNFNKIDQSKNEKHILTNYDKYSTNNLEKYHTPVIIENIVCDDCINFNFNDISDFGCQSNQKINKIVFTTIKKI